jgi:TolB-like protein
MKRPEKIKFTFFNKLPFYLYLIVMLLYSILILEKVHAQTDEISRQVKQAVEAYRAADFETAIGLLAPMVADTTLDKADKKEVYRILGLSYTAKGLYDKAKEAISELIKLEPPLVELDPDREPPKMMKIYYEVRKDISGSYLVERPDPGMKTMAILDFMNRSIDDKEKYDPLEKGFSDLMIHQLYGATNLKVVERERIQWILEEIKLENDPKMFDPESAVRIGKQLGVHTILLGSFIKFKNDLWLGARLVKVESSEILMTEEVKGKADKFFDLSEQLASQIAKEINIELSPKDIGLTTETSSLNAMMSYSEGLALLEKGDYKGAYQKFQEALKYDPNYKKARYKAKSIEPFIS